MTISIADLLKDFLEATLEKLRGCNIPDKVRKEIQKLKEKMRKLIENYENGWCPKHAPDKTADQIRKRLYGLELILNIGFAIFDIWRVYNETHSKLEAAEEFAFQIVQLLWKICVVAVQDYLAPDIAKKFIAWATKAGANEFVKKLAIAAGRKGVKQLLGLISTIVFGLVKEIPAIVREFKQNGPEAGFKKIFETFGEIVGGLLGWTAGTWIGALAGGGIGTFFGGPAGTVLGASIGGFIGGAIGFAAGSCLGKYVAKAVGSAIVTVAKAVGSAVVSGVKAVCSGAKKAWGWIKSWF